MAERGKYKEFDEYIRQGTSSKRKAAYEWSTAIGLQAVDGLKTSDYLSSLAKRNIEGEITIDEVGQLLDSYYEHKTVREADDDEKREADKTSRNIKKILSTKTFDFSTGGFISIHRRIFEGVFKHAGRLRDYDITKKEWVLEGDTVNYLNWEDLRRALDYDISTERAFSYNGLLQSDIVSHIARFISGLWQIHPFGEGNTRTTAVFAIQYLRSMGFNVENDLFAKHSWYFRNALVRANYKSVVKGIDYSPVFLERFFRNLLLGEKWDLRNRYLRIHPAPEWSKQPNLSETERENLRLKPATPHVPSKYPTSTPQTLHKLDMENPNIERLIGAVGEGVLSVREMMGSMGLRDRRNFLDLYLKPAMEGGYVRMLHPNSPRHPKQKYLLTEKGKAALLGSGNSVTK